MLFAELLAHPGVEEEVALRSKIGFLAFHGGSLERMTDVIAGEAAERADASAYLVRLPENFRWHIPSVQVRPEASTDLRDFLDHVDVAIALHGYGRVGFWTSLLAGGGNRELAGHLSHHLGQHLPGYEVVTDLDRIPSRLRGLHPKNPVNRPRQKGVQLELPPRVRGLSPKSRPQHKEGLIAGLAAAAASWLRSPDHGPAHLH